MKYFITGATAVTRYAGSVPSMIPKFIVIAIAVAIIIIAMCIKTKLDDKKKKK